MKMYCEVNAAWSWGLSDVASAHTIFLPQVSWCLWMTSTSWAVAWWWPKPPTMSSTPPFLTPSPPKACWHGRGWGWRTVWHIQERSGLWPSPCTTPVSAAHWWGLCQGNVGEFITSFTSRFMITFNAKTDFQIYFLKSFYNESWEFDFLAYRSDYARVLLNLWRCTNCHSLPTLVGTYNNQYMVLDRSKVKLGHSVDDGALTVVEQIPGLVEYSDQTQALRRGSNRGWFHRDISDWSFRPVLPWQHLR